MKKITECVMEYHDLLKRAGAVLLSFVMALGCIFSAAGQAKVQAANRKSIVISFVHRNNIGDTSDMDLDAISSATVFSSSTGEKLSTIEVIRDTIKKEKKAKSFEIKVKKAYSKDYRTTVARAREEIEKDTKVKLKKTKVSGLNKYKNVYLCVPIWHITIPQPVKVFLEANDFSGKTIYVFGSHLGSGFAGNIETIKELCPGAEVVEMKTYSGDASNKSVKKSVKKLL